MVFSVRHACGHIVEHEIIGVWETRLKEKSDLEKKTCPECQKHGRKLDLKKLKEENREKTIKYGLKDLQGTDKQISWANDVRIELLEHLLNEKIAYEGLLVAVMNQFLDGKYWIEQRDNIPDIMSFALICRGLKELSIKDQGFCHSLAGAMNIILPAEKAKPPAKE